MQENSFENVVWKMAAILSRPQCVNSLTNYSSSVEYNVYCEAIQDAKNKKMFTWAPFY